MNIRLNIKPNGGPNGGPNSGTADDRDGAPRFREGARGNLISRRRDEA